MPPATARARRGEVRSQYAPNRDGGAFVAQAADQRKRFGFTEAGRDQERAVYRLRRLQFGESTAGRFDLRHLSGADRFDQLRRRRGVDGRSSAADVEQPHSLVCGCVASMGRAKR